MKTSQRFQFGDEKPVNVEIMTCESDNSSISDTTEYDLSQSSDFCISDFLKSINKAEPKMNQKKNTTCFLFKHHKLLENPCNI